MKYAIICGSNKKLFWSGQTPPSPVRYWKTGYWKTRAKWVPNFSEVPHTFTLKTAIEKWKKYEFERQCGEDLPDIEIVKVEFTPVKISRQKLGLDYRLLVSEKIRRNIGQDFPAAFQEAFDRYGKKGAQEYQYGFTRKQKGLKKADIEEMFPSSITYAFSTLIKTETELVYAKVSLGAQLKEHFELTPFYLNLVDEDLVDEE